jgi:hypothetical protein
MTYKWIGGFLFIMLLLVPDTVFACTSFAVYSSQVYYGMNFDFINLPMKFLISVNGDIRTFHLAFERTIGEMKFFVNTAGMNSKGLFASCQELYPEKINPPEKTDANIFTFELYESIASSRSAEEVKRMGQTFPLIDMPGITLHNLFADRSGWAFVTETGTPDTVFTEKEGNFIVMTNFPNASLAGKKFSDAEGKGAERYITCHEFLGEHADSFNIGKGFELLSMCCNKDPQYPTMCSLVFDPQQGEVFIVMERNFSTILKLSIENGTIQPFKGYAVKHQLSLPAGVEGILAEDLKQYYD